MISAQQLLDLIEPDQAPISCFTVFDFNGFNKPIKTNPSATISEIIVALLSELYNDAFYEEVTLPDKVLDALQIPKCDTVSTKLFKPLINELKRITPLKMHQLVLGKTIATELKRQRVYDKTPTVPAPIDEFSTASFLAWCKSNKLTAQIIYKMVNDNQSESIRLELLWELVDKKSIKLAKFLITRGVEIDHFSVANACYIAESLAPKVLTDYNYSSIFTIYREIPKTKWKDHEIYLCIAYLTLPGTPNWLPHWIATNCPIEPKHLAKQYQPITMEQLNDYK